MLGFCEWLCDKNWMPVVATATGVVIVHFIQWWQKRSERKSLARALSAELEYAFEAYKAYEFPAENPMRKTEIPEAIKYAPRLMVYEKNTDKLGLFEVDDIKQVIEMYVKIEEMRANRERLRTKVEAYEFAVDESMNDKSKLKEKLPPAGEKLRDAMSEEREGYRRARECYEEIMRRLKKY